MCEIRRGERRVNSTHRVNSDTINPQRREENKLIRSPMSCWRWSGGGILLSASTPQCDLNQQLQLGAPAQDTKGSVCEYRTAQNV